MQPRRIIDSDVTADGDTIELVFEAGQYLVKINGAPLMSAAMYGSEQAMAKIAAERLGNRARARVLVGGLGMGYTLRAALDGFSAEARMTVAELLPAVIRFNRGELAQLAQHPLDDPRVTLFEGDVRDQFSPGAWDAVLLDVDNGPEAFTVPGNASLYSRAGIQRMAASLAPGGVCVIWSAFASAEFERLVAGCGLLIESRAVRARASGKGPRHTLFVIQRPKRKRA